MRDLRSNTREEGVRQLKSSDGSTHSLPCILPTDRLTELCGQRREMLAPWIISMLAPIKRSTGHQRLRIEGGELGFN